MEKDPSGFQFKIFEEETKYERKKLAAKGLGVLGLFFFCGVEDWGFCLWVWFFADLFYAYL